MLADSKSDQDIDIEERSLRGNHGKSASIYATISLVRIGAPGPKSRTGRPVKGSSMILASK